VAGFFPHPSPALPWLSEVGPLFSAFWLGLSALCSRRFPSLLPLFSLWVGESTRELFSTALFFFSSVLTSPWVFFTALPNLIGKGSHEFTSGLFPPVSFAGLRGFTRNSALFRSEMSRPPHPLSVCLTAVPLSVWPSFRYSRDGAEIFELSPRPPMFACVFFFFLFF